MEQRKPRERPIDRSVTPWWIVVAAALAVGTQVARPVFALHLPSELLVVEVVLLSMLLIIDRGGRTAGDEAPNGVTHRPGDRHGQTGRTAPTGWGLAGGGRAKHPGRARRDTEEERRFEEERARLRLELLWATPAQPPIHPDSGAPGRD